MNPLRILLLAPAANPESISTSLVTYSHAEALSRLHDVTLVTGFADVEKIRRADAPFRQIVLVPLDWLYSFHAWCVRRIFRNNYGSHLLTAIHYPFQVLFEWKAWRQLKPRIMAGEFDVVLRIAPIVSVAPSPFAFFLRNGPIPFVIGPINGGLPWPGGFSQAARERQLVTGLRDFYWYLPFSRSTYRHASAIIAGSSQTAKEFAAYSDKVFFVPENGLSASVLSDGRAPGGSERTGPLRLIYVGRLVPYKGCDMALRAVAPLVKRGMAHFTIVGDGIERASLEALTDSLGIQSGVSFEGMLSHADTIRALRCADVLVFPSVREFGGGVVFEALAVGVVPIVADFGGPGDIVTPEVGFKVSLTNEDDVVKQIQATLDRIVSDRPRLERLRQLGMAYAASSLSWDGKARTVTKILNWVVHQGPKPDLPAPKLARSFTPPQAMNA